jgi:hypothetical protein
MGAGKERIEVPIDELLAIEISHGDPEAQRGKHVRDSCHVGLYFIVHRS